MILVWIIFLTSWISNTLSYKQDSYDDTFDSNVLSLYEGNYKHFCTAAVHNATTPHVILPAHCLDTRIKDSIIQKIRLRTLKHDSNDGFDSNNGLRIQSHPTFVTQWIKSDYKSVGDLCVAEVKGYPYVGTVDEVWAHTKPLRLPDKDFYLIRKIWFD